MRCWQVDNKKILLGLGYTAHNNNIIIIIIYNLYCLISICNHGEFN